MLFRFSFFAFDGDDDEFVLGDDDDVATLDEDFDDDYDTEKSSKSDGEFDEFGIPKD